jgi:Zn-dependent protease
MNTILQIAALLFSVAAHESAHAWMAEKYGDLTGRNEGRITLNPIPHLDLIGSLIFPLMLAFAGAPVFGWAKPVMVNPYNLRNPRRAMMWIAAAGPLSNLIIGFAGMVLFLFLKNIGFIVSSALAQPLFLMLFYLVLINVYLAIFNLIPIFPLDGSKILEGLLKGQAFHQFQKIKPYSFILLILIIFTGVLQVIANPILGFILGIMKG